MLRPADRDVAYRRGIFERHVRDCKDCNVSRLFPDQDVPSAVLCLSGQIMIGHYTVALMRQAGR